jgi:16S rRNA (guanine966-N2)-methyltransferase
MAGSLASPAATQMTMRSVPDGGRVVTGSAGGLRLTAPGPATRPLSDKVKQSLFSIMQAERDDIWTAPALDLYAGSGAAGIEALSRGAPAAVMVERDLAAVKSIAANLEHTRLRDLGRIVRRDVLTWLDAGPAAVPETPFGCVFLDPPYALADELAACLDLLGEQAHRWCDPAVVIVAKHFWKNAPAERIGMLLQVRQRRFGETALSVYRRDPHLAVGEGR